MRHPSHDSLPPLVDPPRHIHSVGDEKERERARARERGRERRRGREREGEREKRCVRERKKERGGGRGDLAQRPWGVPEYRGTSLIKTPPLPKATIRPQTQSYRRVLEVADSYGRGAPVPAPPLNRPQGTRLNWNWILFSCLYRR